MSKHPLQPVYVDNCGVLRFKPNKIVAHLLDNGGIDMNDLACLDFTKEDRRQFAQLIGYSVGGYGELSYADYSDVEALYAAHEQGVSIEEAKIKILEDKLHALKVALREPMANLYDRHPDDLMELP